ncbi:MAG: C25 family cysteine peptidase [Candidatus Thermoplasmatota archaeon]|nr:C25 family cysteine peptidase [Candidatus Thermoplasmatota archaeon]
MDQRGRSKIKSSSIKIFVILLLTIIVVSAIGFFILISDQERIKESESEWDEDASFLEGHLRFSYPEVVLRQDTVNIYVKEADFNSINDQWPVLPVNITTFELPFGSKIIDVMVSYSDPEIIKLPAPVAYGSCSIFTKESKHIYSSSNMFPSNHFSYHTGGGLSNGEHTTFVTVRIYPVTYVPMEHNAYFIENISFRVFYEEPVVPLLQDVDRYDLLIISPNAFVKNLDALIDHKNKMGVRTELVTVEEIDQKTRGRDLQEKIKYHIKEEIENAGIDYVLLVGGLDRQSSRWTLPVRYSHVLIREGTQEIIEPRFISDLYYADIYDSEGNFSCWDTNENDVFGEYDAGVIDEMDLYPDVYIGRLPCRNKREVSIIVDKIITYETKTKNSDWFKNILLVSGDHWNDEGHINEGVLIMQKAKEIMDDFNPIELYTTEDTLLLARDIRKAMNKGAGFAYFCGHGGIGAWGIHYPPDASGWAPTLTKLGIISFYRNFYMSFLRNREKLPVTIVGGCNNGQFDVSFMNMIRQGRLSLSPHCWAWHLTIQKKGGSIATIANTGLGTHAMDDADNNGVNDYLEVYDGWLELKLLELYQRQHLDILGENQGETMTSYLHSFLGSGDEMDIKMVQQWQLFGDPTLKIGGY